MDFHDTAVEATFREEVRTWLSANIPTPDELKYIWVRIERNVKLYK